MKLHIKKIAAGTLYKIKHPSIFYRELTRSSFPKRGYSKFQINSRLFAAYTDIVTSDFKHNIGSLSPKANRYAVRVYQKFISANPNNIGNWSTTPVEYGTRQLENEVIHKLINLYHGEDQNLEGYVTSGGTEGNLYSVWVGKSFVTKHNSLHEICLCKTNLTHYSIDKACSLCSVKEITIPLNPTTWTMDPLALETEMEKQIRRGVYGFIISLTFGYTETGSSDNVQSISAVIQKLKKQYKKMTVSIIIDAACDGLIEPFINNNFQPFISKDVHAVSVDFSKFTAVPYPAGAVIYRTQLRRSIERSVPVFSMPDNTLLGSRPGASVAAIWATLHQNGIAGYKKIIENQLKIKNHFIQTMLGIFPNAEIMSGPYSLTCGILLNKKYDQALPKQIEERYWIYAKKKPVVFSNGKTRNMRIYKFFFLPHITKKAVDDIVFSIKQSVQKTNNR